MNTTISINVKKWTWRDRYHCFGVADDGEKIFMALPRPRAMKRALRKERQKKIRFRRATEGVKDFGTWCELAQKYSQ